jgi:hypothetical protein
MQRVSYITDSSGKHLAIVIDMEVWNSYLRFHPEVMHFIGGNTFENTTASHVNIFGDVMNPIAGGNTFENTSLSHPNIFGEVINPIAGTDFQTETGVVPQFKCQS